MKILSFDTSNSLASVAIKVNNKVIAYNSTDQASQQAEKLFLLIKATLQEVNLELRDIDLVTITSGPGSFTGVRIAMAAALGMQIGSKAQFISLTNFQILAWKAKNLGAVGDIGVALDARRDQVYFQLFSNELKPLCEAKLLTINETKENLKENIVLIGEGSKYLSNKYQDILPNAQILCEASEFFFREKSFGNLIPLYIREPDITLPSKKL